MEGFGDAVLGDFDVVGVFGLEGAVFEGGGEEVVDGEREALAGVGGLYSILSVGFSRYVGYGWYTMMLGWPCLVVVLRWLSMRSP